MGVTPHYIDVDFKKITQMKPPKVTQNDTATTFVIRVTDNGLTSPTLLDEFTTITLTSERSDNKPFYVSGTRIPGKSEVIFNLGTSELEKVGRVDASLQFYRPATEGDPGRTSTAHFYYEVMKDLTGDYVPSESESSLIEIVLIDGPRIMEEAEEATRKANTATTNANTATGKANTAATNADNERTRLNTQGDAKIAQVEAVRLATEGVRVATESVRVATNTVRTNTETERLATKAEKEATAAVRQATDTVRTETIAAKEGANTAGNYAKAQGDISKTQNENQLLQMDDVANTMDYIDQDFLPEVVDAIANFDSIVQTNSTLSQDANTKATTALAKATTVESGFNQVVSEAGSSNPEVVLARGTHPQLKDRLNSIDQNLSETERQTQILQNGQNVLNADVATPVDFEIQGRTLASMANSNLEAFKYYALADKKTKVAVDGVTVAGIGKFQKKSTTVTVADFVGKVSGSTVANPHELRTLTETNKIELPNNHQVTPAQGHIDKLSTINGASYARSTSTDGNIAQVLFSFNVVEQVERQLGIIPKATLAEKVQWVTDNVSRLTSNWYGFGSSPIGNKATFSMYSSRLQRFQLPSEGTGASTHSDFVVAHIKAVSSNISERIQPDGFVYLIAYTEPSDGVTPSTINTDYINLEIELKSTAQLNTRGAIIRVENFEGKVSGSVVENPNKAFTSGTATSLLPPGGASVEFNGTDGTYYSYPRLVALDGNVTSISLKTSGSIAQHAFAFNVIEAVERNIGRIPANDLAGKVAWVKSNVASVLVNWYGYGISPSGNKATLAIWHDNQTWHYSSHYHSSSSVGLLKRPMSSDVLNGRINSDGMVHALAFAEPSDGVTSSSLYTDYVELEIELKPDADFRNPKVPLYEVTKEEYDKIGITWTDEDVLKRFPKVEGVQHLVNPYVKAEGENLLPPFSEWVLNANAKLIAPYEIELDAKGINNETTLHLDVIPNTNYTIQLNGGGSFYVRDEINAKSIFSYTGSGVKTFTTPTNCNKVRVVISNFTGADGKYIFKNPMLTLGSTPKPFTPHNPSYLFAETKLGAIGDKQDTLFRQDGQWKRRKVVETMDIDGSIAGIFIYGASNNVGFKGVGFSSTLKYDSTADGLGEVWDHNLEKLAVTSNNPTSEKFRIGVYNNLKNVYSSLPNFKTGFVDESSYTKEDFQRYFNGWKYTDGTTWVSVTGNGQTATAQQALDTKPTDHTPYKLSYVLATPIIEDVVVEGDIVADGLTQIEVGSGIIVREKANPYLSSGTNLYYLNWETTAAPTNKLLNKVERFIGVYRNGVQDSKWKVETSQYSFGKVRLSIPATDYDPTAEYTVTYLVMDKPKVTVNPTDVKATFAKTIRNAVDDIANRLGDTVTRLSIVERAVVDFYVKLKALGGPN